MISGSEINVAESSKLQAFKQFIIDSIKHYVDECKQGSTNLSLSNQAGIRFHIAGGKRGQQRAHDYILVINSINSVGELVQTILSDLVKAKKKREEDTVYNKSTKLLGNTYLFFRSAWSSISGQPADEPEIENAASKEVSRLGNSEELAAHIVQGLCVAIINGFCRDVNESLSLDERKQLNEFIIGHHTLRLIEFRDDQICLLRPYKDTFEVAEEKSQNALGR